MENARPRDISDTNPIQGTTGRSGDSRRAKTRGHPRRTSRAVSDVRPRRTSVVSKVAVGLGMAVLGREVVTARALRK